MASMKIKDMAGSDQGELEVSENVFAVAPNDVVLHDVVVALRNSKRQGTHKVKTRSEVSGGGQKPFRQKGTGRARQGSIREPHMRGGGSVFGPQPRSYRQKVPTRMRRQALCYALSARLREDRILAISNLSCEAPKSKTIADMVNSAIEAPRKTLLVLADNDKNVLLSARNIPRVEVRTASDVNALDVLLATNILVQQEAIAKLEERLS